MPKSPQYLRNKTVVLTGVASGFGRRGNRARVAGFVQRKSRT